LELKRWIQLRIFGCECTVNNLEALNYIVFINLKIFIVRF